MDNNYNDSPILPVEIVLSPSWWNKHAGISFDEDYFFHPARRVEAEQKMEKVLYEKWGQFGLGSKNPPAEPIIGAIHLASGFLVQEMAGCLTDVARETDVVARFGSGTAGKTARAAYALIAVVTMVAFVGYAFQGIGKFCSVYVDIDQDYCAS